MIVLFYAVVTLLSFTRVRLMKSASITFLVACAFAAGCSRPSDDNRADAPSAEPTASKSTPGEPASSPGPASRGASECEDYFRMVSRCIETKMPDSERASERQGIEQDRKLIAQLPATAAAATGTACTANIRNAIRQDRHGCYFEEATKRGIQTACAVMPRSVLEEIVAAPLEEGVQTGRKCTFAFVGNPTHQPLQIVVHWKDGRDEVEAARGAQAMLNARMKGDAGKVDFVGGVAIDGLGDDAFLTVAGMWPTLSARSGDVAVQVDGATREQLIAIAREALPRIQPDSGARASAAVPSASAAGARPPGVGASAPSPAPASMAAAKPAPSPKEPTASAVALGPAAAASPASTSTASVAAPTPAATVAPSRPAGAASLEQALAAMGKVDVYSIYFSFDSDLIRGESEPTLKELAEILRRHPDWRLRIAGHTDGIGGDEHNLDLSMRRAASVKEALVTRYPIGADRLTTTGFGKSQPKDTNGTPEGRARNRRVEIVRL